MDTRKYILFILVMAAILVQGTYAASFISPSLKAFSEDLDNKYNRAAVDEHQVQRGVVGSSDSMMHPNIIINNKVFPLVALDAGAFGSKVLYSDGDIGRVLNDFEYESDFYFWDVGLNDGEFDPGDVLYYHININNSLNIGQNDIRLTGFGIHPPGSKVDAMDVDFNKALTPFPSDSSVRFADQYGSLGYDLMDPVYFHINGSSSQIDRMDLRMSYFAYGHAGTLVNGLDLDRGLSISELACKFRFYNINGNVRSDGTAIYDKMDPVYLDFSGDTGRGFVVVNDVRLS